MVVYQISAIEDIYLARFLDFSTLKC